ncbi:hypothetical protein [Bacteroides sp.]|uniref:hypothetical protein n=1 Tax=Bacteroides sp. TaxID=29523 RepID=UPI002FCB3D4B
MKQLYKTKTATGLLTYILCLLFASCNGAEEYEPQEASDGMVNVTFTVNVPMPDQVKVGTRAESPYTDTDIINLYLLLYDEDGNMVADPFLIEESDLTTIPGGVKFSVSVPASPDKRIVHLLVNPYRVNEEAFRGDFAYFTSLMRFPESSLSFLSVGEKGGSYQWKDEGRSTLLNNMLPLVMWGRIVLNNITVETQVDGIKLLRTSASVQVIKGKELPDNGLSDFIVTGMTATGVRTQGIVAAADYQSEPVTPTEPHVDFYYGNDFFPYDRAWSDGAEPVLYTYEHFSNESSFMSVILAATYKGRLGYYKIDMVDAQGTPLNIVRNHRYIITIMQVNGPGYATAQTAAIGAASTNVKVALTDETNSARLVTDGQWYMGVNRDGFDLYGASISGPIATVYASSRTLQANYGSYTEPYTEFVTPIAVVPSGVDWLEVSLSPSAYSTSTVKGYDLNAVFSGATSRVETTVQIIADNLMQEFYVSWNPSISAVKNENAYVIDLVDAADRNWGVRRVTSIASNAVLHPTQSQPTVIPTNLPGGVSELSSKYHPDAYLHVYNWSTLYPAANAIPSPAYSPLKSKLVEVDVTASHAGKTSTRRVVVSQRID